MYVTPIRFILNTNQISYCKGKWYVRRFDPDTVQNGHIYSSIKEEEVHCIHILGILLHFLFLVLFDYIYFSLIF